MSFITARTAAHCPAQVCSVDTADSKAGHKSLPQQLKIRRLVSSRLSCPSWAVVQAREVLCVRCSLSEAGCELLQVALKLLTPASRCRHVSCWLCLHCACRSAPSRQASNVSLGHQSSSTEPWQLVWSSSAASMDRPTPNPHDHIELGERAQPVWIARQNPACSGGD